VTREVGLITDITDRLLASPSLTLLRCPGAGLPCLLRCQGSYPGFELAHAVCPNSHTRTQEAVSTRPDGWTKLPMVLRRSGLCFSGDSVELNIICAKDSLTRSCMCLCLYAMYSKLNVIFLHPVARIITRSLSSVFVRRLVVYLTLKHLKFTTCFSL
jgi:hypothetical protein